MNKLTFTALSILPLFLQTQLGNVKFLIKYIVLTIAVIHATNLSTYSQRCGQTKSIDQILTSNCDSNSRLEVKVDGIHFEKDKINIPLGDSVKQIIVEAHCRDMQTIDSSTCPPYILYTVDGKDVSVPGVLLNYCSSWVPHNGREEGFHYIYRLNESKAITSLQYNPPALEYDRKGMRGLTTWTIHEDSENGNSPNGLNFDYFLLRVPEICVDAEIGSSDSPRNITIYIPVSEVDNYPGIFYRAEARDVNRNVLASLPQKLISNANIAQKIRVDTLFLYDAPGNAVEIKVCVSSPHNNNPKGPHMMIGSIMITSDEVCDVPPICSDNTKFPTNYSGCVGNVDSIATYKNGNYIIKNEYATVYDDCDYENLQNCSPVTGLRNLSANEALWAVTKAAKYLSEYGFPIQPVNIVVNYSEIPFESVYIPSKNVIVLGKGDSKKRNSMAAIDIVVHEYMHAIIALDAPLGNFGISGAINESYSDIFAEIIESELYGVIDWIFGAEVMVKFEGNDKGIRNISYPKDNSMIYQMPEIYKEEGYWVETDDGMCFHNDNCGIHNNSGVHSYWFYLLSESIGIEKATDIIVANLKKNLNSESTYFDVRKGSIEVADSLFGDKPRVVDAVIEKWDSVGFDKKIGFKISNSRQVAIATHDPETKMTTIPTHFDLNINTKGFDISTDDLCFTMYLPKSHQNLTLLNDSTLADLCITELPHETTICINEKISKNDKKIERFKTTNQYGTEEQATLQFKVCIVSEDVSGEPVKEVIIQPIEIFCYENVGGSKEILTSATLPFGFDYDSKVSGECDNSLDLSLKLNNKNCETLGSVEILNKIVKGVSPYSFTLKNINKQSLVDYSESDGTTYQFYGLESGEYELKVIDSGTTCKGGPNKASKKFSIDFVGDLDGSLCCPGNLTIPPGPISRNAEFYAKDTIILSMGTEIINGSALVCP